MARRLPKVVQIPWTAVRGGAEISLLSFRLNVSQGAFPLTPARPIEKVTLWEGFLYAMSGSETDEGTCRARPSFCPNWESNLHGNPGPVRYPLGYRFTQNTMSKFYDSSVVTGPKKARVQYLEIFFSLYSKQNEFRNNVPSQSRHCLLCMVSIYCCRLRGQRTECFGNMRRGLSLWFHPPWWPF